MISLNSLAGEGFWYRAISLALVGVLITALVYGVVALIVKMDDVGLKLKEGSGAGQVLGGALVTAMPKLLSALSVVGIAAMLWVGATLGWGMPLAVVHALAHAVASVPVAGQVLEWLVETACSAAVAVVVGGLIVAVLHLIPRRPAASAAE